MLESYDVFRVEYRFRLFVYLIAGRQQIWRKPLGQFGVLVEDGIVSYKHQVVDVVPYLLRQVEEPTVCLILHVGVNYAVDSAIVVHLSRSIGARLMCGSGD